MGITRLHQAQNWVDCLKIGEAFTLQWAHSGGWWWWCSKIISRFICLFIFLYNKSIKSLPANSFDVAEVSCSHFVQLATEAHWGLAPSFLLCEKQSLWTCVHTSTARRWEAIMFGNEYHGAVSLFTCFYGHSCVKMYNLHSGSAIRRSSFAIFAALTVDV